MALPPTPIMATRLPACALPVKIDSKGTNSLLYEAPIILDEVNGREMLPVVSTSALKV